MVRVVGIDHLVIRVSDFERSKAFYGRLFEFLGFEVLDEYEDAIGWTNGKTRFWIGQADAEGRKHKHRIGDVGFHHYAFQLRSRRDVDELQSFLEDLGAEIVDPAGEYYEDYYAVFFLDPDGLKLEGMKYGELIGRGVKASRTRRNRAETVPLTPSCQARQTRDRSAGLSSRWPTPGGAGVGPSGGRLDLGLAHGANDATRQSLDPVLRFAGRRLGHQLHDLVGFEIAGHLSQRDQLTDPERVRHDRAPARRSKPTDLGTASHRQSGRAFIHFRSGVLQVGRGLLAGAPVGLKLVGNLLALSEAAQA